MRASTINGFCARFPTVLTCMPSFTFHELRVVVSTRAAASIGRAATMQPLQAYMRACKASHWPTRQSDSFYSTSACQRCRPTPAICCSWRRPCVECYHESATSIYDGCPGTKLGLGPLATPRPREHAHHIEAQLLPLFQQYPFMGVSSPPRSRACALHMRSHVCRPVLPRRGRADALADVHSWRASWRRACAGGS